MAGQPFVQNLLSATFQLANGTFTGSGSDTLTLTGLRMSARVHKAQALSGCRLDLDIYGMTFSQMNDLTTLGTQIQLLSRNLVTLQTGDFVSGANFTAFTGVIIDAYSNFSDMPRVSFSIRANSIGFASVQSATPTSYPGGASIDIASSFQALATNAGFNFENNGVSGTIPGPLYLYGSPAEQMNDLADAAHIGWAVDDITVAIWPNNGSRTTGTIPIIGPDSGLIKYPGYTANGILFETRFNTNIKFQGLVQVKSSLFTQTNLNNKPVGASNFFPANGIWAVSELDHYLDCKTIDGDWKSVVMAYNPKFAPPSVAPAVLQAP